MERYVIHSNIVSTIGYDFDNETLEIESHSGHIYQYSHVPVALYHTLKQEKNACASFSSILKNGYPRMIVR